MKKYLISILIINIFILGFYPQLSQAQSVQAPETLEEAKSFGLKILGLLPGATKKVWKEEALPFFEKMWSKAPGFWNTYIWPKFEPWRQKFMNLLGKEVEKRKPDIEKEFQKEKDEMQKELPKAGKSLWERFKELLK